MRGRNRNNKGPNPLTRSYESNGPDVKIRGTAGTIADKYVQLSRDALTSGDPVGAENYLQHAEHYYRLLAAAQAQYQPNQTFVRADAEDYNHGDEEDGGENGAGDGVVAVDTPPGENPADPTDDSTLTPPEVTEDAPPAPSTATRIA